MAEPIITVAMPVRNCASTVGVAIRSILRQTRSDFRLLIIDDGSKDRTLQEIKAFTDPRIQTYSDGRSLGLAARLNEAIQLAGTSYIARMDGDDISYPERLERQVDLLESTSEIDLVGAQMLVFGVGGRPLGYRPVPSEHDQICAHPRSGFPLAHPTWCGRREWFDAYGYNTSAVRCQDQDMLLRSWRHSRFANLPEILLGYREERVDLRKILSSRFHYAGSIAREAGGWAKLESSLGVLEQALKGSIDVAAVTLGAENVLLGHRHRPLSDDERSRWQAVWRETDAS
jgi:glycosyltransferase involved in cell wall biosynthesis